MGDRKTMSKHDDERLIQGIINGAARPQPQQVGLTVAKPFNDLQMVYLGACYLANNHNNPADCINEAIELFCQSVARFDGSAIGERIAQIKDEILTENDPSHKGKKPKLLTDDA